MDLRTLPEDLDAEGRIEKRRLLIEKELQVELSALQIAAPQIGGADERNCEQMFGAVPVPVGLAGPLRITFSSGETHDGIYLPLATTEAALVASVNRGCKALSQAGGVRTTSEYVGMTRSIAFEVEDAEATSEKIRELESGWKRVGKATSGHLKILSYDIDAKDGVLFLTIAADTGEAMGMNMLTIAAQAVGEFLSKELHIGMLTVAGNVDSDKKPSIRTKTKGRGYRVSVEATLPEKVIREVLRSSTDALLKTARAKLEIGSVVAGALGNNLHAANIVAALYLATGQDAAHVVEGSLADTTVSKHAAGIHIKVELPALLVGVRGGGTNLPAQKQCLDLVLRTHTKLRPPAQLAETIAGAVLAGELSLLAAQSTNTLARAHRALARKGR
ncbi:MAG: 3-hydroxy-3-methylglutaryl-CoA reductase [Patescibacteria group bacterium]